MLQVVDPTFTDDPHLVWDRMRADDPVHRVDELGGWVATSYDAVRDLLRHPDFSSSIRFSQASTLGKLS